MSVFTYGIKTTVWGDLSDVIIRRSDGLWIPQDPANTDYQQYLAWLEEGNVPEEWNPEEE